MKKVLTLVALLTISNFSFASELGEDLAADCVSTHQSNRSQEVLTDADATETRVESSSSVR